MDHRSRCELVMFSSQHGPQKTTSTERFRATIRDDARLKMATGQSWDETVQKNQRKMLIELFEKHRDFIGFLDFELIPLMVASCEKHNIRDYATFYRGGYFIKRRES